MSQSGSSRRWFNILVILILLAFLGITAWNGSASDPSTAALDALQSDSTVTITNTPDLISFETTSGAAETALIFYPGGKVDFRAYAPVLKRIAEQGYAVYVPSMPLHLAFLDSNAADAITAAHPEIENWVIAGHSLGGVAASGYAAGNDGIDGVILWASYPQDSGLRNTDIPVLSIYGTMDGLISLEEIEESRSNLPENAEFLAIDGGNHAQFGSYGAQEGDNNAAISADEQLVQIVSATVEFLQRLDQ